MNEKIAKKTIDDHKYLLEQVDNRAAIAYFAVANRNQCLYEALKCFIDQEIEAMKQNLENGAAGPSKAGEQDDGGDK